MKSKETLILKISGKHTTLVFIIKVPIFSQELMRCCHHSNKIGKFLCSRVNRINCQRIQYGMSIYDRILMLERTSGGLKLFFDKLIILFLSLYIDIKLNLATTYVLSLDNFECKNDLNRKSHLLETLMLVAHEYLTL